MSYESYTFNVRRPGGFAPTLKEYKHEGQSYIEGRKGSEYVLYFFNNTNFPVEVVFSVDGLSVIDGKPAGVKSDGYVVRAYDSIEVPGWRIDDSKVAKFVFQPQGDTRDLTYVEALKADGINVDVNNQGVIGCLVFTAAYDGKALYRSLGGYDRVEERFRGISCSAQNGLNSAQFVHDSFGVNNFAGGNITQTTTFVATEKGLGTGFGDDKVMNVQHVTFTRADASRPAWKRVVTYDTLKGLRRRGVPVDAGNDPLASAFPSSPELSQTGCRIPTNRSRG